MDINSAISLSRNLMTRHGVGYLVFGFHSFPREKITTIGKCHFIKIAGSAVTVPAKISISDLWAKALEEHELTEIILHEIAHAKAGWNDFDAHGPDWAKECIALGIEPRIKFNTKNVPAEILLAQGLDIGAEGSKLAS